MQHGTTREYGLRRLRKKAPELHAEVLAGNKTVNEAMVEAGLRRKTITVPVHPEKAAQALIRNFEYEDLVALVDLLVKATA